MGAVCRASAGAVSGCLVAPDIVCADPVYCQAIGRSGEEIKQKLGEKWARVAGLSTRELGVYIAQVVVATYRVLYLVLLKYRKDPERASAQQQG